MSDKPVIFISYSHKDEPEKPGPDEVAWLTFVQSFLAPVVKTGIFDIWVDEHLHGGDVLDPEIKNKLADCDIFVLLASRFSLASTYVVETEIATIRQRQKIGDDVHMFPIVLSSVPNAALKQLKDLLLRPKDGKPLSLMSRNDREVAMADIADDIAKVAGEIVARKAVAKVKPSTTLDSILPPYEMNLKFAARRRAFVDTAHLPETPYEQLVGRDSELKRLDNAWADDRTNILSLVAEGGAGKSALVNEWLKRMRAENYRGAETVLGWSFYSQGTKERATSAEQFLNWAIEKLGIEIETTSSTAKGEAIAEELMKRRILLALDGCEPLQHGLDKQQGELKDQGLRALLRRFAAAPPDQTHGLVVLTSRLAIKDIARWEDDSAPVERVDKLSEEAGAALLRDNGVWGTDKELRSASHDFGGHPLALSLLASYLKEKHFGDVRQRDQIRGLLHDEENPRHDHARRVMESYETEWLIGEPVEHAVIQMVGLFDRPASGECLLALRGKPTIQGLTDGVADRDEGEWRRAVERLRQAKLLSPIDPSAPDALDAHPLVREWFGERLRRANKTAWEVAHARLYEHLRDTTKEGNSPTLESLAPLYQAIAHGCRALRYSDTYREVYMDRICRRRADGDLEYYAMYQLAAYGSDLAAISWFFDEPYSKPTSAFEDADRSLVLSQAAFQLRALGRFADALSAMRASMHLAEASKEWLNAAIRANNVCELLLVVGDIEAAITIGITAIEFADKSANEYRMLTYRAAHADVLHASGRRMEAETSFADAERRQQRLDPNFPMLYSVRGYNYCDLLLAKGEWKNALERTMEISNYGDTNRLGIALYRVLLGRAHLGLSIEGVGGRRSATILRDDVRAARDWLNEAADSLRAAGVNGHIPSGFLARAIFRRNTGDWSAALRDLDEVEEIAEPGPMKLFLCDMALERARLEFAKTEAFAPLNGFIDDSPAKPVAPDDAEVARLKSEAAKHLSIAADYIKTCGYHRRDEELAELRAVLRGERKFADLPPRV